MSNKTVPQAELSIFAMTDQEVISEIESGTFREDLLEIIKSPAYHLALKYARLKAIARCKEDSSKASVMIACDELINSVNEAAKFTKKDSDQEQFELQ